jgi:ubiquinone/menaquinone biosynthesis C-methylase UbiE
MTSYSHDTSKLAKDYDRLSDTQLQSGKGLVERMGLPPGANVLDVGCGTGRLAAWIAERVGPSGQVVGLDPLAERIALARERVPGVRFQVGYAEDLSSFADGSFDGVCMSAVFHWIPDQAKALAESTRVLRPGGKLGFTTLPKELHAASTMSKVLGSVFGKPAYHGRLRLEKFALAHQRSTVTEIIAMVLAAGLDLAELHVMERMRRVASASELIDFMEASSFGNFLSAIPEDLHDTFRSDFERVVQAHPHPEGFATRDWGAVIVARKPAD